MHRVRQRVTAVLVALLLLCVPPARAMDTEERVAQFAGWTLEGIMDKFRQENFLDESNFSLCYYNTVTQEEYCFNETKFMAAGSTYKLPLNLYYYEREAAGDFASDTYIPGAGTTLDNCHRMSLVDSNNEVSIGMLYNLGMFRDYKEHMRTYFTMEDDEIDSSYYTANNYCTRMMMDCLKYLYDHAEDFPEMLDYMTQACPGAYFKAFLEDRVTIAHKYGSFEGAENDVGIIYASQPFLLAVYTQDVGGEQVCARAAELLYDYTEYQAACAEAEREEQARQEAAAEAAQDTDTDPAADTAMPEAVTEAVAPAKPAPEQETPVPQAPEPPQEATGGNVVTRQPDSAPEEDAGLSGSAFAWWMIPVALAVFAVGGGVVALAVHSGRRYQGKYVKK